MQNSAIAEEFERLYRMLGVQETPEMVALRNKVGDKTIRVAYWDLAEASIAKFERDDYIKAYVGISLVVTSLRFAAGMYEETLEELTETLLIIDSHPRSIYPQGFSDQVYALARLIYPLAYP